jgi:hypothetical protein
MPIYMASAYVRAAFESTTIIIIPSLHVTNKKGEITCMLYVCSWSAMHATRGTKHGAHDAIYINN